MYVVFTRFYFDNSDNSDKKEYTNANRIDAMNKSYYKRLMRHAESCQLEADEAAFHFTKMIDEISLLASVQSICSFNLFWLASISPVIIHNSTLRFLRENKTAFTRKLSIDEMIEFDWILAHSEINSLTVFKDHLNRSRKYKTGANEMSHKYPGTRKQNNTVRA